MNKEQLIQLLEIGINDVANLRVDLNSIDFRHQLAKLLLHTQNYLKERDGIEQAVINTLGELGIKH